MSSSYIAAPKCECHDCTQARWKMSQAAQPATAQGYRGPLDNAGPGWPASGNKPLQADALRAERLAFQQQEASKPLAAQDQQYVRDKLFLRGAQIEADMAKQKASNELPGERGILGKLADRQKAQASTADPTGYSQ